MRSHFPLYFIMGLALSGCSINDDVQKFGNTVPARATGLAWPVLAPLGAFALPPAQRQTPDPRSMAARAGALRQQAAALRTRPVLDPARARALRAALRKYGQ